MTNTSRTFYLTCWSCQRSNIPYVLKLSENAVPNATTTVQVACPFCEKLMSVDVPLNLSADATAIKHLPSKQA